MPNITGSTTTTEQVICAILPVMAARALEILRCNTPLAMLISTDWEDTPAQCGDTVKVPSFAKSTPQKKLPNTPINIQPRSLACEEIVVNCHLYDAFLIEDTATIFACLSRPTLIDGFIEGSMIGIAEQVNTDIAAQYVNFANTVDGTGGVADAELVEIQRVMDANKCPVTDRYGVMHEDARAELIVDPVFKECCERTNDPIINGTIGRHRGFDLYMSQLIPVVGGPPGVIQNLFFHKRTIGMATRPLPSPGSGSGIFTRSMSMDGIGVRVMSSYDHGCMGWLFTIDLLYGLKTLRPECGVVLTSDENPN